MITLIIGVLVPLVVAGLLTYSVYDMTAELDEIGCTCDTEGFCWACTGSSN